MKGIVREHMPGVFTVEYMTLIGGQVSRNQAIPVSKSFSNDVKAKVGMEIEFMPCEHTGGGTLAYPINSAT